MKEFIAILKTMLSYIGNKQLEIKGMREYLSLSGYRNIRGDLRVFKNWFLYSIVQSIFTNFYVNSRGNGWVVCGNNMFIQNNKKEG